MKHITWARPAQLELENLARTAGISQERIALLQRRAQEHAKARPLRPGHVRQVSMPDLVWAAQRSGHSQLRAWAETVPH